MDEGAQTLRRLLTEGPPAVQLKAALALLQMYPKLVEDYLRRSENMESDVENQRRGPTG